jgi:hypothetical protein
LMVLSNFLLFKTKVKRPVSMGLIAQLGIALTYFVVVIMAPCDRKSVHETIKSRLRLVGAPMIS